MARPLDRIWFRFGLLMTVSMLLTLGVLFAGFIWEQHAQQTEFQQRLPPKVRQQLDHLLAAGQTSQNNAKVDAIYDQYWPKTRTTSLIEILIGLGLAIIPGLLGSILVARLFIRPVASVADAALRIAQGDLSARISGGIARGELAQMLTNFNQMADTLQTLERERKQTIAAISHELRTPLTILRGRLHAYCDGVIAPTNDELRKLLAQIEHLARLVDDLNTLALVESNRLSLHMVTIELGQLVQELAAVYAERAQSRGVELQTQTEPLQVNADRDRLWQVLVNILENGLNYAADGGWLGVNVSRQGDNAVIEINDKGPGLPNGVIDRLFDPFVRGQDHLSMQASGTGLGLAVAQGLVKQQGGTIVAANLPGGGAQFTITLPLSYVLPAANNETHGTLR